MILIPYTQCRWGDVIVVGVHIYVCVPKNCEYDRLTFSNIRSRTSRRIYRLALPLLFPEMHSLLSNL